MSRFLSILLAVVVACGITGYAVAESVPTSPAGSLAPLLQQNRLIADVARVDPDNLWDLVSRINLLVGNPRDGGTSRAAVTPTQAEAAQIQENPALQLAYEKDAAATVALLRATNEQLRRERLRATQEQPRRVALVVGSSGDSQWGKLATTQNDAKLVASVLARQGFEIFGGGAVIDPDKAHLLQTIKMFAQSIEPGTVALFYYAGHGVQADARNFIVPAGAAIPKTVDDYDRNLVALDDSVLTKMQQAGGRLNIVILDACRDYPPALPGGGVAHGPQHRVRGLAPMGSSSATGGSGTIIIYSTGPNSIARDSGDGGADSPFASAFAAAVGAGGMEIRDVFDRVQASVDQMTDHQQQPWISYSAIDKFYFTAAHQPDEVATDTHNAVAPPCPKPGTTVLFMEAGQAVKGTYQPIDPAAPAVCRLSTSGGDSRYLLYNLYDPGILVDPASATKALMGLFSSRQDRAEFLTQLKNRYPFPTFLESWVRVGRETLKLDKNYVQTIVFEHDTEGVIQNGAIFQYHKRWKVWYDPTKGVVRQTAVALNDARNDQRSADAQVVFVSPF